MNYYKVRYGSQRKANTRKGFICMSNSYIRKYVKIYGGKQDAEEIKKYRYDIRFDLAMWI